MCKHLKRKIFGLAFCIIISPVCATYNSAKPNMQVQHLNNSMNEYSASDDFSKILLIIKNSLELSDQMISEIHTACADFKDILTPTSLCKYENIMQSKELVSTFVNTLDQYEKKYKEELVLLESRVKEAFLEKKSVKRSALKGFKKDKATSMKLMSEYFFIAREGAQIIHDVLDFSSAKLGSFWESNGALIFKKDEDAAMYNTLLQELIEISKEEAIIFEKLKMNNEAILKKMEHIVGK